MSYVLSSASVSSQNGVRHSKRHRQQSVDAFTHAVFAAEGIEPTSKRLYAQVHEKVQRRLGEWMTDPTH